MSTTCACNCQFLGAIVLFCFESLIWKDSSPSKFPKPHTPQQSPNALIWMPTFWETLSSKAIWRHCNKSLQTATLQRLWGMDCYPSVNRQFGSGILLLTNTIAAGQIQIIADPLFAFRHATSEYAVCTRLGDSHYLPYEHRGLGINIAALPSYRSDSLQLLTNNVTQ